MTTKDQQLEVPPGKVKSSELSAEAHGALWYALASIPGAKRRHQELYQRGIERASKTMSEQQFRAALQKGLAELALKGLITVRKDGMGGWEPTAVLTERFEADEFSNILHLDGT